MQADSTRAFREATPGIQEIQAQRQKHTRTSPPSAVTGGPEEEWFTNHILIETWFTKNIHVKTSSGEASAEPGGWTMCWDQPWPTPILYTQASSW